MAGQRIWHGCMPLLRQPASFAANVPHNTTCLPLGHCTGACRVSSTALSLRPPPRAQFRNSTRRRRAGYTRSEGSSRLSGAGASSAQVLSAATSSGRYGTANEPPHHLVKAPQKKDDSNQQLSQKKSLKQTAQPKHATKTADAMQEVSAAKVEEIKRLSEAVESKKLEVEVERLSEPPATANGKSSPSSQSSDGKGETSPTALSQILQMEPPMSDQSAEKPPHLHPPPYVHHFDTFTLVRALQDEGTFSAEQAVTLMKAVRVILADNMDMAQDGIVSKADSEMAAYLFRAACGELRTEMRNNRSTLTERLRAERSSLQHEVDILSQRITAELGGLKDELKGMLDDRQMSVRMDRRRVDNMIQELNYDITSKLNSEVKSEVEGLRWVLVRRTAIALAFVVATALFTLRLSSTARTKREAAEAAATGKQADGVDSLSIGGGSGLGSRGGQSADIGKGLDGGGDPSLVSLG